MIKRTIGHEIGHILGLVHPWSTQVSGTLPAHDTLPSGITLSSNRVDG